MKKTKDKSGENALHDLDTIFRSYEPQLLRYLLSRVKSQSEAKDLAQEAYLRLIRVPNMDLIKNPQAYLFRIAVNLTTEFQIKNSARQSDIDLQALEEMGGDGDGARFERQIDARFAIKRLDKILRELPPIYRTVLIMRKRDGYSHKEISEKLGISGHRVHRYLKHALAKCRADWTD